LQNGIETLASSKANKVSNATAGNIPTLDENGNLTNGVPQSTFATPASVNAKQDKISASTNGYLATHSGTAGQFGSPIPQSTFLTPSQAASGYFAKGKISLSGNTLYIDLT